MERKENTFVMNWDSEEMYFLFRGRRMSRFDGDIEERRIGALRSRHLDLRPGDRAAHNDLNNPRFRARGSE
jgi:hypothetical protein